MPFVVACDLLRALDGILEGAKCQQAVANGKAAAETGILYQGGLARRQVANRSIAEPAALRFHVDSLGDGELGAGLLHVAAKAEWISCRGARVSDLPAIGTQ